MCALEMPLLGPRPRKEPEMQKMLHQSPAQRPCWDSEGLRGRQDRKQAEPGIEGVQMEMRPFLTASGGHPESVIKPPDRGSEKRGAGCAADQGPGLTWGPLKFLRASGQGTCGGVPCIGRKALGAPAKGPGMAPLPPSQGPQPWTPAFLQSGLLLMLGHPAPGAGPMVWATAPRVLGLGAGRSVVILISRLCRPEACQHVSWIGAGWPWEVPLGGGS